MLCRCEDARKGKEEKHRSPATSLGLLLQKKPIFLPINQHPTTPSSLRENRHLGRSQYVMRRRAFSDHVIGRWGSFPLRPLEGLAETVKPRSLLTHLAESGCSRGTNKWPLKEGRVQVIMERSTDCDEKPVRQRDLEMAFCCA